MSDFMLAPRRAFVLLVVEYTHYTLPRQKVRSILKLVLFINLTVLNSKEHDVLFSTVLIKLLKKYTSVHLLHNYE